MFCLVSRRSQGSFRLRAPDVTLVLPGAPTVSRVGLLPSAASGGGGSGGQERGDCQGEDWKLNVTSVTRTAVLPLSSRTMRLQV